MISNETISSSDNLNENNITSSLIIDDKEKYDSNNSLAIYKKKDDNKNIISLEKLNEISQNDNSEYYNNIKNKINIDYYLHLSKQIVDTVNKNIYDLTYLNNLTVDSKDTISKNMIENMNKINKFFEIKLRQFTNNDFKSNDIDKSQDFTFLGRKRLNFIERNNIQKITNLNLNKQSEFLQFSDLPLDKQYLPDKGVRYTISDFDFIEEENNHEEKLFEEILLDNKHGNEEHLFKDQGDLEENKKPSKNYFKYKLNKPSNIGNIGYEELDLKDRNSIILKRNDEKTKYIKMPLDFDNLNENVNSLFCKDFFTMADDNSEFFRRVFSKMNIQKKVQNLNEEIDLHENVFEDSTNKNGKSEKKIKFDIKKY